MNYAYIKDAICTNIIVFSSETDFLTLKDTFIKSDDLDDIVELKDGFGIGDIFKENIWYKGEIILPKKTEMEILQDENLDRLEESVDHEFRIIELEFLV